jgi:RNA polymerase sigma factor (sigma-70 family)
VWSQEDADDLAQDLALVILAHHTGPPDAEGFVGWCCGVARNLAAHRRRSEMRRLRAAENPVAAGGADSGAERDNPESSAMLRESLALKLDGLNPVALCLLRDRFVMEETSEEIAARLNVSSASVRMRIARLLAELRVDGEKSTGDDFADRYDPCASGNNG